MRRVADQLQKRQNEGTLLKNDRVICENSKSETKSCGIC
jgi:hypothetical protein